MDTFKKSKFLHVAMYTMLKNIKWVLSGRSYDASHGWRFYKYLKNIPTGFPNKFFLISAFVIVHKFKDKRTGGLNLQNWWRRQRRNKRFLLLTTNTFDLLVQFCWRFYKFFLFKRNYEELTLLPIHFVKIYDIKLILLREKTHSIKTIWTFIHVQIHFIFLYFTVYINIIYIIYVIYCNWKLWLKLHMGLLTSVNVGDDESTD